MALPVIQSRQDSDSAGAATTFLNMVLPSGTVEGDFLVIIVGQDETSSVTFSATNFTQRANTGDNTNQSQGAILTGNVSATDITLGWVRVNSTGSDEMWGTALRITGADETTPTHGTPIYATVGSATNLSTGTTSTQTTVDDCITFAVVTADGADMNPFTIAGTDWDGETVYNVTSGTSGNDAGGAYSHIDVATAAQISECTFTGDGTSDGLATILWSLAPAAGGAVTVTPSGVSGTAAVTVPTVQGKAVTTPTGVSGTGQVGDGTIISLPRVFVPTGVAGTGQVGDGTTVQAKSVVQPAGVSGTGEVEPVTIHAVSSVDVPVTGVSGSGQVGDGTTIAAKAVISPTGVSGTGQVDSVSIAVYKTVIPTGVEGTGAVTAPTVEAKANISPTGVSGSGSVGEVTVDTSTGTDVLVTGLEANAQAGGSCTVQNAADTHFVVSRSVLNAAGTAFEVGINVLNAADTPFQWCTSVAVTADANVSVTGLEGTGEVGSVTVDTGAAGVDVPVTGVSGTGSPGTVTVTADANIDVVGVEGTGEAGSGTTIEAKANVFPIGITGTGEVGSVTVQVPDVTVLVNGVSGIGEVGSVTVLADAEEEIDTGGANISYGLTLTKELREDEELIMQFVREYMKRAA